MSILFGLLTLGIGDDVLQVARTISRKLDDVGDVARLAGRRLADDAADLGRTLRRHGDELAAAARQAGRRLADDLADARRALSRHSDELADAARVQERMHTFVNRSDDALRRRLDDWVVRGDDSINLSPRTGSSVNENHSFIQGSKLPDQGASGNIDYDHIVQQSENNVVDFLFNKLTNNGNDLPENIIASIRKSGYEGKITYLQLNGVNVYRTNKRTILKAIPGTEVGEGHFITAVFRGDKMRVPGGVIDFTGTSSVGGVTFGRTGESLEMHININFVDESQDIVTHEIFHWIAADRGRTGFSIGGDFAPFNEGVTEYFNTLIRREVGTPSLGGYENHVRVIESLTNKLSMSDKQLLELYIRNDLTGLKNVVDTQLGQGALEDLNTLMFDMDHRSINDHYFREAISLIEGR